MAVDASVVLSEQQPQQAPPPQMPSVSQAPLASQAFPAPLAHESLPQQALATSDGPAPGSAAATMGAAPAVAEDVVILPSDLAAIQTAAGPIAASPPSAHAATQSLSQTCAVAPIDPVAQAAALAALLGQAVPASAGGGPKELEEDSKEDSRRRLSEDIIFHTSDTTLNLLPSVRGNVLMALMDGGMQHLLAGARANVGISKGRYMFEVRVVEQKDPAVDPHSRAPVPRQLVKLGFSTSGSTLFLGESADSVCFDSEGAFTHNRQSTVAAQKLQRDQVVGVLLNLEDGSPNANTVSMFRDGVRISQPQPLPESLRGKTLFPHVVFKNITVHVNFGPSAARLPFSCRMLADAAEEDVVVARASPPMGKDGKYEVVFPVCLPDEGGFDWLDGFLAEHPQYVELSDRKILEWAAVSGIWRNKGYGWKTSNDKPEFSFGTPQMTEQNVRRMISTVAAMQERNYVVMEVRSNLIKNERVASLLHFNMPHFQTTARVVMCEPPADVKQKVHSALLMEKQEQADIIWKQKRMEEERRKAIEKMQMEREAEVKKIEEARRKADEAARSVADEEEKAGEVRADGEGSAGQAKDSEASEEVPAEAKAKGAMEKDEAKASEPREERPPAVELTEEERRQCFRRTATPDLNPTALSASFASFSLPGEDEGFGNVSFAWQQRAACAEYLRKWILDRKLSMRVEDLVPGEWFAQKMVEWQTQLQKWHAKQSEYKDPTRKAAAAKAAAEANGGEQPKTSAEPPLDAEELDVFDVDDVCDLRGTGEPLFSRFEFEDWALLSLRFEVHLLAHAFRRDVKDEERVGIVLEHLPFYYNKYFRKALNAQLYGVETYAEVMAFVRDVVTIDPKSAVLEGQLSDELDCYDLFIKLTEEGRRDRTRLIDSGDDSAQLKFVKPSPQAFRGGAAAAARPGPYHAGTRPPMGGKGFPGGPSQHPQHPQHQHPQHMPGAAGKGHWAQGAPQQQGWGGKSAAGKGYSPVATGKPQGYAGKGGQYGGYAGKGAYGK